MAQQESLRSRGRGGRTALLWGLALVAAAIVVGLPAGVWASDAFNDVPEGNTHHDAVGAITDAGVTLGCAPGQYCPSNPVRRDQMASFMDRLGALSGQDPVVNAATAVTAQTADSVEGMDAVLARLDSLEEENAALAARTAELEADSGGDNGALAARVDELETDNAALAARVEELEAANGGDSGGDNGALAGRVDDLEDTVAALDGTVTGQGDTMTALQSTVTTQGGTIDDLDTRITDLEEAGPGGDNGDLADRVGALETTFDGVTRENRQVGPDELRDTLVFEGMNLQLLNGHDLARTNSTNGLGNLILGYNEQRLAAQGGPVERTGSHSLVVGDAHGWTSWATVIGGARNTATGSHTAVFGTGNTASGGASAVLGGTANVASAGNSSVTGGSTNTASHVGASVSGGQRNQASGGFSTVGGGQDNVASAFRASVSGGSNNAASGDSSSILGGADVSVSDANGTYPSP